MVHIFSQLLREHIPRSSYNQATLLFSVQCNTSLTEYDARENIIQNIFKNIYG